MTVVTDIQAVSQVELHMLAIVGMLNRDGETARNLYQELLPSNGYGIDTIITALNSLVTKAMLTLPVPYGTASGPADVYAAVYRVSDKGRLVAGNYALAEMVRAGT